MGINSILDGVSLDVNITQEVWEKILDFNVEDIPMQLVPTLGMIKMRPDLVEEILLPALEKFVTIHVVDDDGELLFSPTGGQILDILKKALQ